MDAEGSLTGELIIASGNRRRGAVRVKMLVVLLLLALAFLVGLWRLSNSHHIWVNAHILTMDEALPVAESISWRGGIIEMLGSNESLLSQKRWYTKVRDLRGQTVLPGFVDAHSHFPANGIAQITTNLAPPPLGNVSSLVELYAKLGDAVTHDAGELLLGFNYDNASLLEGTHPTRQALDLISTQQPIYAYHSSGHMGVANTAALKMFKRDVEDFPQGLLQEKYAPHLGSLMKSRGPAKLWRVFTSARDEYLAQGVTTANNGATPANLEPVLRALAATPLLPMRIVVTPLVTSQQPPLRLIEGVWQQYENRVRAGRRFFRGGAKIIVDGSPQGFTAYLTKPFYALPPATELLLGEDYRGKPFFSTAALTAMVAELHTAGWQVSLHGNGDAAIDLILDAIEAVGLTAQDDHRSILIHSQTARQDQIVRMQALGVTPSFFVAHVFYWGDWHRKRVVGPVLAENISPTGWAAQQGLRFSLHSDAPVTPMRPFELASHAMQRTTQSGRLLGAEHRLPAMQALRALTLDAAWQLFLDDRMGSLTPGKFADLIVVSDNPIESTAESIASIKVLETVIGGRTAYQVPP